MSTASEPTATPAAPILGDAPVRTQPAPAAPAQGAQPQGQPTAPAAPVEPVPYEHPALEKLAKGKYRTVEEVAQAYESVHKKMRQQDTDMLALSTRLGSWKGPPKDPETGELLDYELAQSPEALEKFGPIDKASPEYQFVNAWAKKHGASPEAVNDLLPLYEQIIGGDVEGKEDAVRQILVEHYGSPEAMSADLNNTWAYMEDVIGEGSRPAIRRLLMSSPEVAPLLSNFVKGLSQVKLPTELPEGSPASDTHDTITQMRSQDPNWRQNPEKMARYNRFLSEQADRDEMRAAGGAGPLSTMKAEDARTMRRG